MKALIIYSHRGLSAEQRQNISEGLARGIEARGVEAVIVPVLDGMSVSEYVTSIIDTIFNEEIKPGDLLLFHGSSDPNLLAALSGALSVLSHIQEVEGSVVARFTVMPYMAFTTMTPQAWELLNVNETTFAGVSQILEGFTGEEEHLEEELEKTLDLH